MMVMMMVPRGYMLQWQGTSQSFSHGVSFCILVLVEKLGWYPPFFHRKDFLLSCKKDSTVCCCCLCLPNSSPSWFWVWSKKRMHWNEFNNSKTYSKLFVSAQAHSWLHFDTPVLVSTNSENLAKTEPYNQFCTKLAIFCTNKGNKLPDLLLSLMSL